MNANRFTVVDIDGDPVTEEAYSTFEKAAEAGKQELQARLKGNGPDSCAIYDPFYILEEVGEIRRPSAVAVVRYPKE